MKYTQVGTLPAAASSVLEAGQSELIILRNILVTSVGTSHGPDSWYLYLVPEGETADDNHILIYKNSVAINNHYQSDMYICLRPGDSLWAYASAASRLTMSLFYYSSLASMTPIERSIAAGQIPRYP